MCWCSTHLLLQRQHQDPPHLEHILHVALVLLLHPRPAVHPVVLTAVGGDLQAVPRHEARLAELKPAEWRRIQEE